MNFGKFPFTFCKVISTLKLVSNRISDWTARPFEIHGFHFSKVLLIQYLRSLKSFSLKPVNSIDSECTRGPCPVISGPHYSKERQNSGNRAACGRCPCQEDSIGMPTLNIGSAVPEKNGTVKNGFSFIVIEDLRIITDTIPPTTLNKIIPFEMRSSYLKPPQAVHGCTKNGERVLYLAFDLILNVVTLFCVMDGIIIMGKILWWNTNHFGSNIRHVSWFVM